MKTIEQALWNFGQDLSTSYVDPTSQTKSLKETPQFKRVSKKELEIAYLTDPLIFNAINVISKTFMASTYRFVSQDQRAIDYLNELETKIRIQHLVGKVVKHMAMFGDAWVEIVYNRNKSKIVGLEILDPKRMDYLKDGQNRIVIDKNSLPMGYVQEVSYSALVPKGITVKDIGGKKGIVFGRDQISHFMFETVGDEFYGIGLIEPIYYTVKRKANVEEGLGQAIFRTGFPMVWAKAGNENHEPTPSDIQNILKQLKDINYRTELVTPYYVDLQILESKSSTNLHQHLDYFVNQQITGFGIPKSLVTGTSETGLNRATLNIQNDMFERTLKGVQEEITYEFETHILRLMAELENWSDVPKMEWSEINVDESNTRAQRLTEYVKSGLLLPTSDIRQIVRKEEDLPKEPSKYSDYVIVPIKQKRDEVGAQIGDQTNNNIGS